MEKEELQRLRKRYSISKKIPAQYEEVILIALSHYSELKYVRIEFKLTDKNAEPYCTHPSRASFLKQPQKRTYVVSLLEKAKFPVSAALFKNLDRDEQIAVIAHELVHVLQFHKCSVGKLMQLAVLYLIPSFKKRIERAADIGAIEHGFGRGLYRHALYLRSIPGYLKKRPELNKYYLKPAEILSRLD